MSSTSLNGESAPARPEGDAEWESDMQLFSMFSDRKEELIEGHGEYVRSHPELKALMADFLQHLLLRKPEDVYSEAASFFAPYGRPEAGQQSDIAVVSEVSPQDGDGNQAPEAAATS